MATKKVSVGLFTDNSCEMAKVKIGNQVVFEGNFWDFHPGCHGSILMNEYTGNIDHVIDDFHGASDFFHQIIATYYKYGFEVKETKTSYKYRR
jgi:hypothetical protein